MGLEAVGIQGDGMTVEQRRTSLAALALVARRQSLARKAVQGAAAGAGEEQGIGHGVPQSNSTTMGPRRFRSLDADQRGAAL
jgi:hypothetical protein